MESIHSKNILSIAEKVIKYAPIISYDYPEMETGVHVAKKELIDEIKKSIYKFLERYTQDPDYLISIRWFYTQKLIDFTHNDPIIPYSDNDNEGLRNELIKLNANSEDINDLKDIITDMIDTFDNTFNYPDNLQINNYQGNYIFQKRSCKFTLCQSAHEKLVKLHKSFNPESNDDIINKRIFNLLCRYESLAAPGYHASIPNKIFTLLRSELNINHELFASPFNCNLEMNSYTSAYPDTDKFFGSKGNFFNIYSKLFEKGGSFEANPPFLEEHIAVLSLIINRSLSSEVPLSFVVFYPSWEDSVGYQELLNSQYNVISQKVLHFERNDHYYIQSSQYWLKGYSRKSNSRSAIFILQNNLGKIKYQVTPDFINKLCDSFKNE